MSSQEIITLLLAVVGGAGASIVTGLFGMPAIKAGAKATKATGEVALSGDARAWAETFAERADKAEARADKAEARADSAEQRADQCERRCDDLETRLDNWQAYALRLQRTLEAQGIAVPPPPDE